MSQWPLITVHNCDHVCKGALCVCGGGGHCVPLAGTVYLIMDDSLSCHVEGET